MWAARQLDRYDVSGAHIAALEDDGHHARFQLVSLHRKVREERLLQQVDLAKIGHVGELPSAAAVHNRDASVSVAFNAEVHNKSDGELRNLSRPMRRIARDRDASCPKFTCLTR
jgi:hypothetical protein